MKWSNKSHGLISLGAVVAASLLTVSACGDGGGGGGEVVNFYIFNGYAGSSSMSLYGPSGTIVTGLGFGARSGEAIAIDRNLGTEFTLVLDGAPQSIDLTSPLFALYPHETGTMLLKRRSGLDEADATTYRHVQSAGNDCRIVFDNALSTLSDGLGNFGYMVAFDMTPAQAGYADVRFPRTNLMTQVGRDSYYYLVTDEGGLSADLKMVWAGPGSRVDFVGGSVQTFSPTLEYEECLGEDPDGAQVLECQEPVLYRGTLYQPENTEQVIVNFQSTVNGSNGLGGAAGTCNTKFRIFSDFFNIFDDERKQLRGDVKYGGGNHMFWILYGRPVAPLVLEFATDDSDYPYAELPAYPAGP
ncbi:MAG: hypothetical protein H0U74_09465 [Bradymonadaceae bacterium]|nr:hypothetical protein [Lujinxingiaceae bacterium]